MKSTLKTVFALTLALAFAEPAWAQTSVEEILQDMADQGYSKVRVSRTLLGRTKIRATTLSSEREVVVTRSGQVLKDETVKTGVAIASGATGQDGPNSQGDATESSIGDVTPTMLGDEIDNINTTPVGVTANDDKTLSDDAKETVAPVTSSSSDDGPAGSASPAPNENKGP